MKKEYMIVSALILCLGIGIIIGFVINNKKTEKNDNNAEYVEKLEKDNEELNKQLEEINNRDCEKELKDVSFSNVYHEKLLKEKQKIIEKLNGVLKSIESKDNGYQYIVDNVMEKYFEYSFYMHSSPYYGETNHELEKIDDPSILNGSYSGSYFKSYTFQKMEDVKSFFKGFLSDECFNNNVKKFYVEKDNGIYCYNTGKAGLKYESNGSVFRIISLAENKIEVYCIINVYQLNFPTQIEGVATLIKENDNWVVDEYIDFY